MFHEKNIKNVTMLTYSVCTYFLLITLASAIKLDDYCKPVSDNTPCKYRCERSSRCGDTKESYKTLTDAEREHALKKHNELRQKVAVGTYKDKNLPAASDMKVLSYDKECEFVAGCYIKQCVFAHDTSRVSLKGENMGQNLFTSSLSKKGVMDNAFITKGIEAWFNEVDLVTPKIGTSFMTSFKMVHDIGHFTQMIWPTTEFVGCAMLHNLRKKGMYTYDLFCNYKPAGNVQGKVMYGTGEQTCEKNADFPNLCGKIRPLSDDSYTPPMDLSAGIFFHPTKMLILFAFGLTLLRVYIQ